jgi:hypothetical protein
MSFAKHEKSCLKRLADLFEQGTTATSVQALFNGMAINDGQKHAICESLKNRGIIKATYQLGQSLPYRIEILAAVVTERDNVSHDNKFDRLKSGLLSSWLFGIPAFVFVVVAAIITLIIAIAGFYGFSPTE